MNQIKQREVEAPTSGGTRVRMRALAELPAGNGRRHNVGRDPGSVRACRRAHREAGSCAAERMQRMQHALLQLGVD